MTTDVAPYRPALPAAWKPDGSAIPVSIRHRPSLVTAAASIAVTGSAAAVGTALTVGGDWPAWSLTAAGVATVVMLLGMADRTRNPR